MIDTPRPRPDGQTLIAQWRSRGAAQRTAFYDASAHHHSWSWDACADELEAALTASPVVECESEIHTGDDELLDALTGARAALEEVTEIDPAPMSDEVREAIDGAIEELTRADAIRVQELRKATPAPPSLSGGEE